MTISKIDILNKKLNRCMRGYCPEEVDLLVHEVAETLGMAADENRKLAERVAELLRELSLCAKVRPQPALQDALDAGRKIVEELQENARLEARQIVDDARSQGSRIISEANILKAKVLEEIVALNAQKTTLDQQLRTVLEEHFRLLEGAHISEIPAVSDGDFIFAEGASGDEG